MRKPVLHYEGKIPCTKGCEETVETIRAKFGIWNTLTLWLMREDNEKVAPCSTVGH